MKRLGLGVYIAASMLFGLTAIAPVRPALTQTRDDKKDLHHDRKDARQEDKKGAPQEQNADDAQGTFEWYGKIKAHGQGNIYNDTAEVSFGFSVEADGAIKGRGRAKVTSEEQSFANCRHSRKPPDPFDFTIGGHRVGDEFQLELENPKKPVAMTGSCPNGAANTITANTSAFLGAGGPPLLRPTVAAKDRATNELHNTTGAFTWEARIEIHRRCPAYVSKVAGDEFRDPFGMETPGDIAPDCTLCSDPWELTAVDLGWINRDHTLPPKLSWVDRLFGIFGFPVLVDQPHEITCVYTYKAVWRCPKTGETRITRKSKTEADNCIPRG